MTVNRTSDRSRFTMMWKWHNSHEVPGIKFSYRVEGESQNKSSRKRKRKNPDNGGQSKKVTYIIDVFTIWKAIFENRKKKKRKKPKVRSIKIVYCRNPTPPPTMVEGANFIFLNSGNCRKSFQKKYKIWKNKTPQQHDTQRCGVDRSVPFTLNTLSESTFSFFQGSGI